MGINMVRSCIHRITCNLNAIPFFRNKTDGSKYDSTSVEESKAANQPHGCMQRHPVFVSIKERQIGNRFFGKGLGRRYPSTS
jgi:hypothetical protein